MTGTNHGGPAGHAFERATVDGNDMAFFPHAEGGRGASGALAQGESYRPGKSGARVDFGVHYMTATLARAVAAGSTILLPDTDMGAFGRVAEIEDSEGNCIAPHATPRNAA